MKHPSPAPGAARHLTTAIQREQALCMAALETGEYDNLSDEEWIALSERIAREGDESADPDPGDD